MLYNKVGRYEVLGWYDVLVHQERCKDLWRDAERYRRIQRLLAGYRRPRHLYCRALSWLGRRLVGWGLRLQERYGTVTTAPALCMVDCPQRR